MLIVGKAKSGKKKDMAKRKDEMIPPATGARKLTLALDKRLGLRYAAVSYDYNPIHLHPALARLAGQPQPIAHGMWTLARCLAEMNTCDAEQYCLVKFKLPAALPSEVRIQIESVNTETRFDMNSGEMPNLVGVLRSRNIP